MSPDVKTELNVRRAVPLFCVRDMQASLGFYVAGLGFTKTNEWIDEGQLKWCWLELDAVAIMLQTFVREGPHRNMPECDVGVGLSMNFICTDALTIYRDFRSRGVDAKRPFVGNSMWVTEVTDPDGYRLFFESPTDVAEETIYTE